MDIETPCKWDNQKYLMNGKWHVLSMAQRIDHHETYDIERVMLS